jgi:hypothetical protein
MRSTPLQMLFPTSYHPTRASEAVVASYSSILWRDRQGTMRFPDAIDSL